MNSMRRAAASRSMACSTSLLSSASNVSLRPVRVIEKMFWMMSAVEASGEVAFQLGLVMAHRARQADLEIVVAVETDALHETHDRSLAGFAGLGQLCGRHADAFFRVVQPVIS